MNRKPPRLASAILRLLVPADEQESIPGDLEEEFATANRSNLWYWRQVLESTGHLTWRLFARSGLAVLAGGTVMAIAFLLTQASVRVVLPVIPRNQPAEFAFTLAVLGIAVGSAAAAGYVGSVLARGGGIRTRIAMGMLLMALTGYWLYAGESYSAPLWYRGALIILVLPAAAFGWSYWPKRARR